MNANLVPQVREQAWTIANLVMIFLVSAVLAVMAVV